MPGEALECLGADKVVIEAGKDPCFLTPEFLNTLHPPGLPPHQLHIKVGAIYMLIRSINVNKGLCNGTRFVVHNCDNRFLLVCRHVSGIHEGELFCLPRFLLSPTEKYPFSFQRRQFPCIPAFAMTINKCQGSTFDELGVDLTSDCFSHGQAYVAYSRVRGWSHLHVLLPEGANSAKNVVSREVLDMAFRDDRPRPTSFHPESGGVHQHWLNEADDADRDAEALADNYDVLQDVLHVGEQFVGHFGQYDGSYIDRDEDVDAQGAMNDTPVAAADPVPHCMAPQVPYVIEGYRIDYKINYKISSAGHLTLQPASWLKINDTHPSKLNSAIAAMRWHAVAFRADLESFSGRQNYPVKWTGQQADYIRPILAKEYLLLSRIQQLKLACADSTTTDLAADAVLEDAIIAKYAHDIGTEGCFMPTSVFWLISQVCVVGAVKPGSTKKRAAAYWSPFSVCLFEIDGDSLAPGSVEVKVKSNNIADWTALVYKGDDPNGPGSVVTLACILLNWHYSSAEIWPNQIAGRNLLHVIVFRVFVVTLYLFLQ
jgi:hypothetical protein